MKIVNKKAYYNYQIVDDYIAGLVLLGSEVKSLLGNNMSFGDSYIFFRENELWIKNLSISKYKESSYQNHDELRERKLLLNKSELDKISKMMETKGLTIIPLEILRIRGRFKLKIGVCKGKKDWNKKEDIKKRDIERENRRDGIVIK
jgi:SsrA-binding protein